MSNSHNLRTPRNKKRRKPVSGGVSMRREYDFANAERGKFYHPEAEFSFPVYLDRDIDDFMTALADEKQVDVQELVNEWLRAEVKLLKSIG